MQNWDTYLLLVEPSCFYVQCLAECCFWANILSHHRMLSFRDKHGGIKILIKQWGISADELVNSRLMLRRNYINDCHVIAVTCGSSANRLANGRRTLRCNRFNDCQQAHRGKRGRTHSQWWAHAAACQTWCALCHRCCCQGTRSGRRRRCSAKGRKQWLDFHALSIAQDHFRRNKGKTRVSSQYTLCVFMPCQPHRITSGGPKTQVSSQHTLKRTLNPQLDKTIPEPKTQVVN